MFDKVYRVNNNYKSLFLKENPKTLVLDDFMEIKQTIYR